MKRVGRQTIAFERRPRIFASAAVAGRRESEGPLGADFDQTFDDSRLGAQSWEQAEALLQKEALGLAMSKGGVTAEQIHLVFAGDLLNQCISSVFGLRSFGIPFLGQYGACATMTQSLLLAAVTQEGGAGLMTAALTSSHFCTAERQFRTPLEYGSQRAPTAQWTVTGSGCALVGNYGPVSIRHGLAGKIVDLGVKDAANMGAAMAPAAADSLCRFFSDTGTRPRDYDGIFTGDLGRVGSELLLRLLDREGYGLSGIHRDCGLMIYDTEVQDVHAGGSGCGCCASVLCGHILKGLRRGQYRNVLVAATGALMSPTSSQQGESIPGVAHVVHLVREEEGGPGGDSQGK